MIVSSGKYSNFYNYIQQNDLNTDKGQEWVEFQLLCLMHIHYLYTSGYDINDSSKFDLHHKYSDWEGALSILNEISFYKRLRFSKNFCDVFEGWSNININSQKMYFCSIINDYCLSEDVYSTIKNNRCYFEKYSDGGDILELWESATFLFERYNKKPFSSERYNRIYG